MIKKIFTLLNLCLIAMALYFGISGMYRVLEASLAPMLQSEASVAVAAVTSPLDMMPFSHYQSIIKRNLFKTQKEASAPKPVEEDTSLTDMPTTELNIKLWGTITGREEKDYAVIEDLKERKQSLYRVGDEIQTAKIKRILREKVVLTVGGQDQILTMEETPTASRGLAGGVRSPFTTPRMADRPPAVRAQRITLRRSQIEGAMANVSELMGQIKIQPHFENGRPDGLMLSSVQPRSVFRRMGLRNGDIIRGVDGRPIETVDDAMKFYENIRTGSSLTLELKRRGRPKTIEYNIRD